MKRKALTEAGVKAAKKPGRYCDGNGLWLQVGPTGGKSWLHRYMIRGKARAAGIGPYPLISLKEARQRVMANQRKLLDGIDPLEERQEARQRAKLTEAGAIYLPGMRRALHRGPRTQLAQ